MRTFDGIPGQPHMKAFLGAALRSRDVPHAILLTGEDTESFLAIARAFGAALLCEDPQEGEDGVPCACGVCASCMKIAAGDHPDFIEAQHEKPGSFGVDDVRRLRQDVRIKPYSGDFKIYLLPDAEKLTAQAQNALLKTLEEPPDYAVLILAAKDDAGFLPTVLSRCVRLPGRPMPEEELKEFLMKSGVAADGASAIGRPVETSGSVGRSVDTPQGRSADDSSNLSGGMLTESEAELLAGLSGGSPGRAMAMAADETFFPFVRQSVRLFDGLANTGIRTIADFLKESVTEERQQYFVELLRMWCRDALAAKRAGKAASLIFGEEIHNISTSAALSFGALAAVDEATLLALRRLRAKGNADLILELMLLRVREAMREG